MLIIEKFLESVMSFISSRFVYIILILGIFFIEYMILSALLLSNEYFNPYQDLTAKKQQEREIKANIVYLGDDVKTDFRFNKAVNEAIEKQIEEYKFDAYKGTVYVMDYVSSNGFWYIFDLMLATESGERNEFKSAEYPSETLRLFMVRNESGEYLVAKASDSEKVYELLKLLTTSAQDHGFDDLKINEDNNLITIRNLLQLKNIPAISALQRLDINGVDDDKYVLPFYNESGEWVIKSGFEETKNSIIFSPLNNKSQQIASPANGFVDLVCIDPVYNSGYVKIKDHSGRTIILSQLNAESINVKLGQIIGKGTYLGDSNTDLGTDKYGSDGCVKEFSTAIGNSKTSFATWICKDVGASRPCGRQSENGVKMTYDEKISMFEDYSISKSTVKKEAEVGSYSSTTYAYSSKLISKNKFSDFLSKSQFVPGDIISPAVGDKVSGGISEFKILPNREGLEKLKTINVRVIRTSNGNLIRQVPVCTNLVECSRVEKFSVSIPSYAGGILILVDRITENGENVVGATSVPYSRYLFR